ncbi:p-hydroxybenzoic acid efflux pump subunit aaeB [Senna tora]|uniref:p-hydroxybenzoic acid efflux pump subunit aaeB n=1 Tax=Senna tora TaxID=362788 RepID=A0A834WCP2_9FABA|nr:p-hydroxybenzoic acid efflux pump subunit aaeB [Senna tora]
MASSARLRSTNHLGMHHSRLHHLVRPGAHPALPGVPGFLVSDHNPRSVVEGEPGRHTQRLLERVMCQPSGYDPLHSGAAVINGEAGVLIHLIHVATSTALGVFASVLAMLIPYPRLAHRQVKNASRLYVENTCERFNHSVDAISALDKSTAISFFTQVKFLSKAGAKILQSIRNNLDGMHWERPRMRVLDPNYIDPEQKLHDMEIPVRGMDIALSSCASFPVGVIDEELRGVLLDCRGKLGLKSDKKASFNESTPPESKNKQDLNNFPWSLKNLSIAYKHLPTSFFLYCVQLLLHDSPIAMTTSIMNNVKKSQKAYADDQEYWSHKKIKQVISKMLPSSQNLGFAFKCSLSLGLAVLFGLIYDKEDGYWSGLTIAISFDTARQATFSVANARGQGTAMGSIYGVICSYVFQKCGGLRFLALLPWVVFTSFLMHSRMYGQGGGISAVIGALLVLGRNHYGPPAQFAIARIAEATIGLTCFIVIEILMNHTRGASLAKSELSQSLRALQDCIDSIHITTSSDKQTSSPNSCQELREKQKKLKTIVRQLEEFTAEAEMEPNFWFLPFHGACYRRMLESLSTMVDLLLFVAYSIENVSRLSQKERVIWVDQQDRVNEKIELFKNKVSPTLKCLEDITNLKSLRKLEKELKNKNLPCDIESGEYPTSKMLCGDEEADSIAGSFLEHLEEMADTIHHSSDEETLRGQMIMNYSCLGFCISGLVRETIKIQNEVKELVMWENPTSHTNLSEIYCKINALRSE